MISGRNVNIGRVGVWGKGKVCLVKYEFPKEIESMTGLAGEIFKSPFHEDPGSNDTRPVAAGFCEFESALFN